MLKDTISKQKDEKDRLLRLPYIERFKMAFLFECVW